MEFTLREIINRLPLKFSVGDPDVLKNLMLKSDNEFLRFRGIDQFDKRAKQVYPEINIHGLYKDYLFARKKACAIKNLCRSFKNHGHLLLQFIFHESMDNDANIIGSEFEILNGVVINAQDTFWNKYLPPNFAEDASSVRCLPTSVYKSLETNIPGILPESYFECDINGLFLSHITTADIIRSESSPEEIEEFFNKWMIDINDFIP